MNRSRRVFPVALLALTMLPALVAAQFRPVLPPPVAHPVPITPVVPNAGLQPGFTPSLQTPNLQPSLAGGTSSPQPKLSGSGERDSVSRPAEQSRQSAAPRQVVPPAPPGKEPAPDGGDGQPEGQGSEFPWWLVLVGGVLLVMFLRSNRQV